MKTRHNLNSLVTLLAVAVLGSGLAVADPAIKGHLTAPPPHWHEGQHDKRPATQPKKVVAVNAVGTISTRVPSCTRGFKAIKVSKRGYTCVMPVKPKCDYGQAWPPKWNASAKRIEYVCVLPEG